MFLPVNPLEEILRETLVSGPGVIARLVTALTSDVLLIILSSMPAPSTMLFLKAIPGDVLVYFITGSDRGSWSHIVFVVRRVTAVNELR